MPKQTKVTVLEPKDEKRNALMRMESQFKMALPEHMPTDRFMRVAMTHINMNPKLLQCNTATLLASVMQAAQEGLFLDGREASLVPYGDTVKYLPQVAGICKKARQSGEIKTIGAEVVCMNDEWDSWTDECGPHFKHRKAKGNRGDAVLTYAYCVTKDDGNYFEEVTEEEMHAIEKSSKAKTGPWTGAFKNEMRKKSAIKRLLKYRVPISTDLAETLKKDDEENYDMQEVEVKDEGPKKMRVEAMLEEDKEEVP